MPFSHQVIRLRRALLRRGMTALPVCGACSRQVQPRDFGREHCKVCEAERSAVSAEWDRQRDEDVGLLLDRPVPEHPAFEAEDAPFLPAGEDL